MSQCKNNLFLKIQTVAKIKNDLFDYVSSNIQQETLSTNKDCFIIKGEKIYLHHTPYTLFQEQTAVGRVSCNKTFFNFESYSNGDDMIEKAWLPVKQFQSKKKDENYALHQGDFIKIGQIELKVRSIQIAGEKHNPITVSLINSNGNAEANPTPTPNQEGNNKRICRICFGDEAQGESPLINPCHCSGGIKYIHLSCLHQWLKTNEVLRSSTNEHCITYTYKKISCELCKEVFPDIIQNGANYYEIWNFIEPSFKSYIILESSTPAVITDTHSHYKTIYIINFDMKNRITIGRSRDTDLRIKDVSVSRIHSEITLTDNRAVTIQDLNSKFGTIVLLQNKKMPIYTVPLTIQIGRHLISMWMKSSFSFLKCLSCGEDSFFKPVNYNRLNGQHISLAKSFTIKKRDSYNETDQKQNMLTQENESVNNNNNNGDGTSSHSSIEEDVQNGPINNNHSHLIEQRNERYLDLNLPSKSVKKKDRSKRFSIPLIALSHSHSIKKYKIDIETDYYFTKESNMKSLRLKRKTKFQEDQFSLYH